VIDGGRPDLKPEQSESWSAGLIFKPRFAPGFRLSVDYTRIEKVDEIQYAGANFLIDNEEIFQDRIVRGANLAGDPPGWAGPITSIDLTLINIASTELEAYDIQADYRLETERFGSFHGYAIATWQPHYRNQVLPISPVTDNVGFSGGLLDWRGNVGLDWDKGALTLSWNAQYYNSYFGYSADASDFSIANFVQNQGSAKIPSQIYHDLFATWRFDSAAGFAGGILANSEISVGIQNLFDTYPPILASFDPIAAGYSSYGDPRLRRYSISIRKNFGR
jgi:outer membrane receptor protein involved in Fe transport